MINPARIQNYNRSLLSAFGLGNEFYRFLSRYKTVTPTFFPLINVMKQSLSNPDIQMLKAPPNIYYNSHLLS